MYFVYFAVTSLTAMSLRRCTRIAPVRMSVQIGTVIGLNSGTYMMWGHCPQIKTNKKLLQAGKLVVGFGEGRSGEEGECV